MGMRASQSHSWELKDVFVSDEGVIRHKPWVWDEFTRGLWAWHGGSFGSVYLGIAKAARDFAIEQTKTRSRIPFKHPESFSPGHQFLAAEMDIALNAAWTFQKDIAVRLDGENGRDHGTLMDAVGMQYF